MIKLELNIKENKDKGSCKCSLEIKESKTSSDIEKTCALAVKEIISKSLIENENK